MRLKATYELYLSRWPFRTRHAQHLWMVAMLVVDEVVCGHGDRCGTRSDQANIACSRRSSVVLLDVTVAIDGEGVLGCESENGKVATITSRLVSR
jgi:hypothetical protein